MSVRLPSSKLFSSLALATTTLCLFASEASAAGDAARGKALLYEKGCAACHSFDGSQRPGPTYAGLVGKTRKVKTQDVSRELVADEAYIKRSILEPNADVVEGYMPGAMPGLSLKSEEVEHLTAAILEIGAPVKNEPPAQGGFLALGLATGAFVFGHLGLSSLTLRRPLGKLFGEKLFQGIYSLVALGAFLWMLFAWRAAPYVEVWRAPPWARWIPIVVMPIVLLLMVCGFSTKNPTSAGQEGAISVDPRGIVRITRHPVLWAFALWGLSHLPPNGDVAAVFLFGGIATLAVLGMLHIDARRKEKLGEAWGEFAAKTSLLPFARGGGVAAMKEIGIARVLVAVVLYVGMLHGHKLLIGVSAMP